MLCKLLLFNSFLSVFRFGFRIAFVFLLVLQLEVIRMIIQDLSDFAALYLYRHDEGLAVLFYNLSLFRWCSCFLNVGVNGFGRGCRLLGRSPSLDLVTIRAFLVAVAPSPHNLFVPVVVVAPLSIVLTVARHVCLFPHTLSWPYSGPNSVLFSPESLIHLIQ